MGHFSFIARTVIAMLLLMLCQLTLADEVTWTGSSGASFETAGNWSAGSVPRNDLVNDTAAFGAVTSTLPTLAVSRQVGGVNLQQAGWTIGGASNKLTIGSGGINSACSGTNTLLHDVGVGLSQIWNIGGGNTLSMKGVLSSNSGNSITKNGLGTLSLANAGNTLTGGIQISQGTVRAEAPGALGTGDVTLAGGTLSLAGEGGKVMPSGLLAWYTFDAATVSGLTIQDVSGNDHHALLNNFGSGAIVDGVFDTHSDGSYVQMPDMTSHFGNAGSVVLWLKNEMATNSDSAQRGFAIGIDGVATNSLYPWTDGRAYFSTFRSLSLTVTLSSTVDRTQWHMVAITMDGASSKWNLYQNDTRVVSDNTAASWSIGSASWMIGTSRSDGTYSYDGWIDNVSVYNRALTGEEVLGLYAAGRTASGSGTYGNNISVTADSALNVDPGGSASLGSLSLNNGTTLAFTGGGTVRFNSTGLAAGATGATLNVAAGVFVYTGMMNDGGHATTWTKTGAGTWRLDNAGNVLGATTLSIANGTLEVEGAADLGNANVYLAAGAQFVAPHTGLSVTGSFTGCGTINLADGAQTFTLNPSAVRASLIKGGDAANPGSLWVKGNLTFGATAAGYAKVQVNVPCSGGQAGVDYDQLNVTGNANLANAQLEVSLPIPSCSMSLAYSSTNVILTAGSLTGTFASVVLSPDTDPHWDVSSGLTYDTTNKQVALTLNRASWRVHDGDANMDNVVDSMDLTVLATNWRTGGLDWTEGDFNFDGTVDVMDLTVLANNWRWGTGGSGSVPEPASLTLLSLGALALIRRRGYRKTNFE